MKFAAADNCCIVVVDSHCCIVVFVDSCCYAVAVGDCCTAVGNEVAGLFENVAGIVYYVTVSKIENGVVYFCTGVKGDCPCSVCMYCVYVSFHYSVLNPTVVFVHDLYLALYFAVLL